MYQSKFKSPSLNFLLPQTIKSLINALLQLVVWRTPNHEVVSSNPANCKTCTIVQCTSDKDVKVTFGYDSALIGIGIVHDIVCRTLLAVLWCWVQTAGQRRLAGQWYPIEHSLNHKCDVKPQYILLMINRKRAKRLHWYIHERCYHAHNIILIVHFHKKYFLSKTFRLSLLWESVDTAEKQADKYVKSTSMLSNITTCHITTNHWQFLKGK